MKISLTNVFKVSCMLLLSFMFTIDATAQVRVSINNTDLAGDYNRVGEAGFDVPVIGTVTGDLAIADDGDTFNPATMDNTGTTTDCCQAVTTDVSGKIALVDRGACNFTLKVQNAADQGAIAVLICNNATLSENRGGAIGMGPTSEDMLIPTISFHKEFCDEVKIRMASETVNITINDQFNVSGSSAAYTTQTPADQILPLQDIRMAYTNKSGVDQIVPAYCEITNPMGETQMLTDTFGLPPADVDPDTGELFAWVLPFTDSYTPEMVGEYTARFWVDGAEINDAVEGINDETLTFRITSDVFSLDDGNSDEYRQAFLLEDGSIDIGTVIPVKEPADAISASFALGDPVGMANETIGFILYKLDPNGDGNIDENGDGVFGAAVGTDPADELSPDNVIAANFYTVLGTETPNDILNIELLNFVDPDELTVPLTGSEETPGLYFLKMEYAGALALDPTFAYRGANSPVASLINATNDTLSVGGTFVNTTQWFLGGFQGDPQFILRLNIADLVDVNLPELDNSQVTLMPNPASETVNIGLDLKETAATVQINLLDIMGRTVQSEIHNNVKDQIFTMDVSTLASGTYFVNVVTDEGRKILKLTVK